MIRAAILALAFLAPAAASALEPISQDRHINDSLRAGFIGDAIRKGCPAIEARMIRAYVELEKLKGHALKQGYSRDEITSFVKDRDEKARLKAEAAAWLKDAGARKGDPESLCAIGRAEIEAGSLIGRLLKASGR